jgi:hypothetical protein
MLLETISARNLNPVLRFPYTDGSHQHPRLSDALDLFQAFACPGSRTGLISLTRIRFIER